MFAFGARHGSGILLMLTILLSCLYFILLSKLGAAYQNVRVFFSADAADLGGRLKFWWFSGCSIPFRVLLGLLSCRADEL